LVLWRVLKVLNIWVGTAFSPHLQTANIGIFGFGDADGPGKIQEKKGEVSSICCVPGNSYSLKAADLKASRKTRRTINRTS